jgi:hypothetical protein
MMKLELCVVKTLERVGRMGWEGRREIHEVVLVLN